MSDISSIRKEYILKALDESDVAIDPVKQFRQWWKEAINSNIDEVNAMTLATVDPLGHPSARVVLLKGFDEKGFVFFTNYKSSKANDLEANPYAGLVFFWKELERQIRIKGTVERVSDEENEIYFQSRPLGSRIGAWASPQSSVIPTRKIIEEKVQSLTKEFNGDVKCPPFWGGYVVRPTVIEFWQGRQNRLHDRIQYTRDKDSWKIERLAP